MKSITEHQIVIPLDFKVACSIYKLEIADVLQIFIDHVSICDLIRPSFNDGFMQASYSILSYNQSKGNQISLAMETCELLYLRNMKQIEKIANTKKIGSTKRNYCSLFVENIFQSMDRLHTPFDIIYLDEYSTLKLSHDFCILCEINNCYPKEYLEHFMNRISLAEEHARDGRTKDVNIIFEFFFMMGNSFGRATPLRFDLTDLEIDFYKRMEEVKIETYVIRDVQERAAIFRELYLSHYQTMNPN